MVALAVGTAIAAVVGLSSSLVPARRALGIQASDALRAE